MSDELAALFKEKDQCHDALREARAAFTNVNTTEEQYDQMEKTLGILYLYCPLDVKVVALATLQEAGYRRPYFNFPGDSV